METNNILTKLPELGRSQYWIPVQNMDRLQIKLARLDRKAEKLGLPGIMFNLHETVSVLLVNTGEGGVTEKRVERFTRVTVAGDAPKVAGWQFVATIQHEQKLNVFRTLPIYEGEIPAEFRTSTPDRCDHCHTNRMRTDTYVVRNDAGQFKQVGRTCLRDFLGHSSPETLAQWASVIFQLKDVMEEFEETGTGGGERVYSIDRVMHVAHAIISKFGYISKAQGELQSKTPTSTEVKAALTDPKFNLEKLLEGMDVAAMEAETAAALAWVAGLGQEELENSSYLYTCFAIVTNDMVRHSQVGFAASILVAYRRDVERRRALDGIRNEHLGTVGEKLTFTGEVTRLQVLEFSTLVNFSVNGACVVWFGSGKQLEKLELGKSYTVTAKVTKHGEFRGVKQTQITRPTIK